MAFRAKKEYGNYKTDTCPFCGSQAFIKNTVGISVCKNHKDTGHPAMKCPCGEWLDIVTGKYGTYGKCIRCGNVGLDKVIRVDPSTSDNKPLAKQINSTQDSFAQKVENIQKAQNLQETMRRATQSLNKKEEETPITPTTAEEKAKSLGIKSWKDL